MRKLDWVMGSCSMIDACHSDAEVKMQGAFPSVADLAATFSIQRAA